MPELLLEVGTEELPATFVRRAADDLLALVAASLRDHGLLRSEGVCFGTPRRLIVSFADVAERQADSSKEQRGPALKGAYDADGNPTPALLGFCRGQGVDPADVRKDDQYVWVTKHIPGRPAAEILAEALPQAIRSLSFDKSMRWGSSRMRFARPIRWLLAAFDGQPVGFEIEGVRAGTESRGHRFYAPESFAAANLADLLAGLRARKVEPDADVRRRMILEQTASVAGGTPDLPPALVDENTYLTEWPAAVQGEFRPEFLELPPPVLVIAMAKHERMFPVRDAQGRLTNRFVFIRNSGEDASVRQGTEWVLNARFNDARFFYREDQKLDLDGFLAKTQGIVFQEKLGTVRARADRLAALAEAIARATGADDAEAALARQAGLYAKADLSTGLVSELSSLQGVIGGEYARRAGLPEAVCHALATHYDPAKNSPPEGPNGRTAIRLTLADQLDKLAGYLGLGLEPSGSSDPFGLRRAATLLIEAAWNWPTPLPPFAGIFERALDLYNEQGIELHRSLAQRSMCDLFASRYAALMPSVRHDILEAALVDPEACAVTGPREVRTRIAALAALAEDSALVQTATRPINIVAAAKKKGISVGLDDPLRQVVAADLDSVDGEELLAILFAGEAGLLQTAAAEDAEGLARYVRSLAGPINRFFDSTMVMADEDKTRFARLTLMEATTRQLLLAGDFSKLVIEG